MRDLLLGLDTELVVTTKRGVLYPHVVDMPQVRTSFDQPFDWHGDGYAWELCVAPSSQPEQIVRNVAAGLTSLFRTYQIRTAVGPSLYMVQARAIRSAPPEVRRLGCMPSMNMYGRAARPGKLPDTLRTTGCHIHTSSPEIDKENYVNIIKWSDVIVGSTWTYVSPEPAFDERTRRKFYGRAGEYRLGFYQERTVLGVEYRALPGNVLHHPEYLLLMLRLSQEAVMKAKNSTPGYALEHQAIRTIDGADRSGKLLRSIYLSDDSELMEQIEHVRGIKARTLDIEAWKKYAL